MRVVSRTVERHRDTTFDKERHAAIAPLVRDDAEGTRRADEEPSGAVASVGRGRGPRRRQEAALAVAREPHRRLRRVELPVPELARDLLVALIEPLAVVRELAAAHQVAQTETDLSEPVGIGERLPGGRHAVRLPRSRIPSACSNVVIPPLVTTGVAWPALRSARRIAAASGDRKSTRLNSSHLVISYAVFCLKKKNTYCTITSDMFNYYYH